MEYPDSVLVFKLLDNAGLSVKERLLVLTAASERKFSSMKSALKRIFGGSSTATTVNEIKIKEEKKRTIPGQEFQTSKESFQISANRFKT